jgi:hypothetical protein
MSEIKMTDEIRKRLAGYLPFSPSATIDFVPEMYLGKTRKWNYKTETFEDTETDCVPEEFRPTFTVRCFNKGEYDKSKKILVDYKNEKDDSKKIDLERQMKELLRPVVMGWKNLIDLGTMQLIEYKGDPSGGCDKSVFESLIEDILKDINLYVNRLSGITPGERLSLK